MSILQRKRRVFTILLIVAGVVLVCVLATTIAEETLALQARRMASFFAPKEYETPPEWSGEGETPLFTFAWVSDFHLNAGNRELVEKGLECIDAELKPDFVIVTGDNCAYAGDTGFRQPGESKTLARQRFLKGFLDARVNRPYYIIPGDNWPFDFDRVFGPKQYAFDYGGVRFIFLSPDRACKGMRLEGLSIFDEETLDWLREDLAANKETPALVVMHEPTYPPTFIDADRIEKILDKAPEVVACLHGHLHVDMEVEKNGRRYLLCPALGRTNPPGMKFAKVYRDRIVFRTLAYDAAKSQFEYTHQWQRVVIPKSLQAGMKRPEPADGQGRNRSDVAPQPFVSDPALSRRLPEMILKLKSFVLRDWPNRVREESE